MSSLFRSEEMTLCEILLHKDNAFDCLAELGHLGLVQFKNLDSDAGDGDVTSFRFTNEVLRCHDLNRILENIESQLRESQIEPVYRFSDELPKVQDLNEIEAVLQQLGRELCDVERNYQRLRKQKNRLLEKWHVLTKADQFLQGNECHRSVLASNWSDNLIVSLLHDETTYNNDGDHLLRLGFLTGLITVERFHSFELMLWRVTYGNFFMRSSEIGISLEGEDVGSVGNNFVKKKAFMVFFQGESMRKKIFKVCQGFSSNMVDCPESRKERTFRRKMLVSEYDDLKIVLHQTEQHRQRLLEFAAKDLALWKKKLRKILMIYFTLNKLNAVENLEHKHFFRAECWIPAANIPQVRNALHRGARKCSKSDEELVFPPIISENLQKFCTAPTFFRLNNFTQVFQNLIDSYGVAAYRELNPAPYTIVTFPFLFSVMFGDVGHGLIITIFSIYMIVQAKRNEKRNRLEAPSTNEIWNLLFAGRYIILLMGIFSIYTGLIYNEVFSKGFCLFGGSRWKIVYDENTVVSHKMLQLDPKDPQVYLGEPYEFGMDPVWDVSHGSAIIMYNSLKMKLSIILGVAQMLFGLSLGVFNNIHARNYIDLWLISVPKIVFFLSLFGYLVFLIFYKWSVYGGYHESPYDSACAPSILITFIDMVIMRGPAEEQASDQDIHRDEGSKECSKYMFPGQYCIQLILMITAMLCVPVILVGKPLYYMYKKYEGNMPKATEDQESLIERAHIDYTEEDRQFGSLDCQLRQLEIAKTETELSDLWIHQVILCIESVLGSVSHTASYLRLWALSLAHDQLSAVLWSMLLTLPLTWDLGWVSGIAMYFTFLMWSFLTATILVMMEGLSAFLHTLRLHWVEFQSKFYYGSGIKFTPFSFAQCNRV